MTTKTEKFTVKLDGYVKTSQSKGTVVGRLKRKYRETGRPRTLYLVLLENGKTGHFTKDDLSDGYA